MSSLAQALVTYEEFVRLPDPEHGRYELHDGEVVLMPPAKPRHKLMQLRLSELVRFLKDYDYEITQEWPYKPAPQFQFWYADVAVIRREIAGSMANWEDYQCYAPDVVVEVLSPSNREPKVNKQRLASMSHGTREFWVIDIDNHVITVSTLTGVQEYRPGDRIEVLQLGVFGPEAKSSVDVSAVFEGF